MGNYLKSKLIYKNRIVKNMVLNRLYLYLFVKWVLRYSGRYLVLFGNTYFMGFKFIIILECVFVVDSDLGVLRFFIKWMSL